MFRVSREAWEKLGDELEKAFNVCKGKPENELTEDEIKTFNRLFYIDCAVLELIEERLMIPIKEW